MVALPDFLDFIYLFFVLIELTNMQWQNTIASVCSDSTDLCLKLKEFFQTQLN